jgi:hypothetical protein
VTPACHYDFFEKEVETTGFYIGDAYSLCLHSIQQRFTKCIHQKTRSHHSTPINPTIGEEHAITDLCPKSTHNAPPFKKIPPRGRTTHIAAIVQFGRPLAKKETTIAMPGAVAVSIHVMQK